MKILVVEDEQKIREGLRALILKFNSYARVEVAENAQIALERCKNIFFDVIFTDIKMPGMDGFEMLSLLDTQSRQIVIISGYAEFSYAQQAIQHGVLDYIVKPVNPMKIKAVLESASQKMHAVRNAFFWDYLLHYSLLSQDNRLYLEQKMELPESLEIYQISEDGSAEGQLYLKTLQERIEESAREKGEEVLSFLGDHFLFGVILLEGGQEKGETLDSIFAPIHFVQTGRMSRRIIGKQHLHQEYANISVLGASGDAQITSEGRVVRLVKDYIHKNYSMNITLKNLSEIVYVHPTYLSKIFKKEVAENISDYIVHYRLEQAKELLLRPEYRINEVSERCGFRDSKYFGTVFKNFVGMTPSEFRNRG